MKTAAMCPPSATVIPPEAPASGTESHGSGPFVVVRHLAKPRRFPGSIPYHFSVQGPLFKGSRNYTQSEHDALAMARSWTLKGGIKPAVFMKRPGQPLVKLPD